MNKLMELVAALGGIPVDRLILILALACVGLQSNPYAADLP